MLKGISFALLACFIWGMSFVIPLFLEGFTAVEITLGRFFSYSLISYLIFFKQRLQGLCKYPLLLWARSCWYSLVGSVIYFLFLVLALRYSTPAMTALIIGISPITISFYANWQKKECTFKSLILPSILIFIGLVIINGPHIYESESPASYAIGLLYGFGALMTWSWFVVANARFLKKNPDVSSDDWSTLMGASILFVVMGLSLITGVLFEEHFDFSKFAAIDDNFIQFVLGCSALGLLCSWLGNYLWNKASYHLPVSLTGQLTILETVFGLFFVCVVDQCLPPAFELLGIALMLVAIVYGIRVATQASRSSPETTS